MKVISNKDNRVKFDNGLELMSTFEPDCCTFNYLDFEQLHIGREFPDYTAGEFADAIKIKKDGFIIKDISQVPAWVQARSEQNGYYSSGVDLVIKDKKMTITPKKAGSEDDRWHEELFTGEISDDY